MDFLLLGPVEATIEGEPVALGRPQERRLLGLLLLEAGRPVPIDRLMDLLWNERPPVSARGAVHTYVGRLRAMLAPHGIQVLTRGDSYLADVRPEQVDVHRFVALAAAARGITAPAERAATLREALALWRGPLMADVADETLRRRVGASLDELRLSTAESLAEARLDSGDAEQVVADLVGLVRENPGRERLVGLLMTALYRTGRQVEALAAYRDTRELFIAEYGVEPGAELQRLHTQVLTNDPALDAAVPARLAPAPVVGRARLPRDIPDLVGRGAELARIAATVRSDPDGQPVMMVVAIVGPPGVGKTALALRWAHAAATEYPDAQLYLDLRGFGSGPPLSPIDALGRLLRALGLSDGQIPTEVDEASDLLRGALDGRRAILVLDNAATPEQVRPLLPGGATCVVLVTSRYRLAGLVARDSAVPLMLGGLSPADSVDLLARIVGPEAVTAEPEAALRLAELCGYLPLALRIAGANAAQHKGRSLAAYAHELARDRLGGLAVSGDPASAVRGVFQQSYVELGTDEQRLFRAMSLLPVPDLAAGAAAVLLGVPVARASELLDSLCAAHLITEVAPDRYALHDLLTEYARERAQSDDSAADREAAAHRLLSWYLHHVDAAARTLHPHMLRLQALDEPALTFANRADASTWLAAERASLLALIGYASQHGPHAMAWLLADGLRGYFVHTSDAIGQTLAGKAVLVAAKEAGDLRAEALGHLMRASAGTSSARHDLAIREYQACQELSARAGWLGGEAAAASGLGTAYIDAGALAAGADQLHHARELNRRAGRQQAERTNLSNLGYLYLRTGPLDAAVRCLTEALGADPDTVGAGTPAGSHEAIVLNALGEAMQYQREFELAGEYQRRALAITIELGNEFGQSFVLDSLAGLSRDTGQYEQALTDAEAALRMVRRTGGRRSDSDLLNTLGSIRERMGQYRMAIELHKQALALSRETRTPYAEAAALTGLAVAYRQARHPVEARRCAKQAVAVAHAAGLRLLEGFALVALAEIEYDRGALAEARAHAQASLDLDQQTGCRLSQPRARAILDQRRDLATG